MFTLPERLRTVLPAALALVICVAMSILAWQLAKRDLERRDSVRFASRVTAVRENLVALFAVNGDLLRTLAAFHPVVSAPGRSWSEIASVAATGGQHPSVCAVGSVGYRQGTLQLVDWVNVPRARPVPPLDAAALRQLSTTLRPNEETAIQNRLSAVLPVAGEPGAWYGVVTRRVNPDTWVFLIARGAEFYAPLSRALPGEALPRLAVRVYLNGPAAYVYRTPLPPAASPPRFRTAEALPPPMESAGRIEIESTPQFDHPSEMAVPGLVLLTSLIASIGFCAAVYTLSSNLSRANTRATQLTIARDQTAAAARRLLAIANRSDNGFIILDSEYRVLWANDTAVKRSGIEIAKFAGRHVSEVIPLQARVARGIEEEIRAGRPCRFECFIPAVGRAPYWVEAELQPVQDSDGKLEFLLCVTRAIATTRIFRDTILRVQAAADSVTEGVCIWDTEATLIYQNRAAIQTFGLRTARHFGFDGSFREDEAFRSAVETSRPWSGNLECTHGGCWHISVNSIANPAHESLGCVAVLADVTAQREIERNLRASRDTALETAQLRSAFLANMGHELRTPLHGITGMLNLLLTTPLDSEQREYAQLAVGSAENLVTLITDLLDYSRLQAGKAPISPMEFEPLPIVESVAALLSLSARSSNVKLSVERAPNTPDTIFNDPDRFRQILYNLVGNALKFTERGSVTIALAANGDALQVRVRDTGPGIDADLIPKLFQPFVQADNSDRRRYGGTGLGLAICSQYVTLMGGEIGVESTPGAGSTFWFRLPASAPQEHDKLAKNDETHT